MRRNEPRLEAPFAYRRELMPRLSRRRTVSDEFLLFAVVLLVLIGVVSWFAGPDAGPAPLIFSRSVKPAFTLGSTKIDVERIQGQPTTRSNSTWNYGNSRVYFRDDRVVGWHVAPGHGLRVRLMPSAPTANPGYFRIGSTKDEVAAVQGTPGLLRDDLWQYGASRVLFRDNRVIGWSNPSAYPLKVRGTPAPAARADSETSAPTGQEEKEQPLSEETPMPAGTGHLPEVATGKPQPAR